ncbi:MAG: hypothetical protein ACOC05_10975 [Oceanicaulis sp.]
MRSRVMNYVIAGLTAILGLTLLFVIERYDDGDPRLGYTGARGSLYDPAPSEPEPRLFGNAGASTLTANAAPADFSAAASDESGTQDVSARTDRQPLDATPRATRDLSRLACTIGWRQVGEGEAVEPGPGFAVETDPNLYVCFGRLDGIEVGMLVRHDGQDPDAPQSWTPVALCGPGAQEGCERIARLAPR